jgi:hypothetical protein
VLVRSKLSWRSRARLIAVLFDCPVCGSHRGEFCNTRGKPTIGHHYRRTDDLRHLLKSSEKFRTKYETLMARLIEQQELKDKEQQ